MDLQEEFVRSLIFSVKSCPPHIVASCLVSEWFPNGVIVNGKNKFFPDPPKLNPGEKEYHFVASKVANELLNKSRKSMDFKSVI